MRVQGRWWRRKAGRRSSAWLLILLALVACTSSPAPDPAATTTRGAELAQLTQVAGTMEAILRPPTTPQGRMTVTAGPTSTPTSPAANRVAVTKIPLVANDLIYEPRGKRLYASVPGRAGAQGNSLIAIDPLTGSLGTPVPLGSEPNRLALSDDGRYIYVGLDGAGAISRYDVTRGVPDLMIGLQTGTGGGFCTAPDIEVVPGLSEIIAVTQNCSASGSGTNLVAYNGITRLPGALPTDHSGRSDSIFCGPEQLLYRYGSEESFRVNAAGITTAGKQPIILITSGYFHALRCDGDYLYGSGGESIDLRTGALAGKYVGAKATTPFYPDGSTGRTFFLDTSSAAMLQLSIYDQARFTLLAKVDLPNAIKPYDRPGAIPGRLVRWGDDGLAFLTNEHLVLVRSSLVDGRASLPTAAPTMPTIAGGPTPFASTAPIAQSRPTPIPAATPPPPASQIVQVGLVTNDIVYDPKTQKIYASVPGIAGANGNSVVPIDPTTGTLGTPIFVGSEPTTLALSDDSQFLYVGLNGANAIRRINLAEQRADQQFVIGSDSRGGAYTPGDIAVMPGHPNTIAVVLRDRSNNLEGVALYIDGIKVPNGPNAPGASSIAALEFCESSATLYGFSAGSSGADFYWLTVDANGIAVTHRSSGVFKASGGIVCDGNRIYANSGEVLDPVTRQQVGKCPEVGLVRPDSKAGRTYYLADIPNATPIVVVCDQQRFNQLGVFTVPKFKSGNNHRGFIRWGTDGLAYRGGAGELFLVRSPLVGGQPTPPATRP